MKSNNKSDINFCMILLVLPLQDSRGKKNATSLLNGLNCLTFQSAMQTCGDTTVNFENIKNRNHISGVI